MHNDERILSAVDKNGSKVVYAKNRKNEIIEIIRIVSAINFMLPMYRLKFGWKYTCLYDFNNKSQILKYYSRDGTDNIKNNGYY